MKNIIITIFAFIFMTSSVLASDLRFVQVDGVFLNAEDKESVQNFKALISKINKEKDVSFVVFTGNNIIKPSEDNLIKFLKTAKSLNKPYYVVLGQKDVNKKKELGKAKYIKLVNKKDRAQKKYKQPNFVFMKKGVVFIVADGSKEFLGTSNGYYRPQVVEWVGEQLDKYQNKNAVILQHYPLVPPSDKESHYTAKPEQYLQVISEHKNVKAVVAGHFGVNNEQEVDGVVHYATKNAPAYRVIDISDCDTDKPVFWSTVKE